MKFRITIFAALVVTLLIPLIAVSELPATAHDPADTLHSMLARETFLVSGEIMLHVTRPNPPTNTGAASMMHKEIGAGIDLHIRWQSTSLFRIELIQLGKTLRTIICDGDFIDTGREVIWSIEFFREHIMGNEAAYEVFVDELWPYEIFRRHLFPMSEGNMVGSFYMFNSDMNVSVRPEVNPEYNGSLLRVERDLGEFMLWSIAVDPERGYLITDFQLPGEISEQYEFANPLKTDSGVWLMEEARYAAGIDWQDYAWASTIVSDRVAPVVHTDDTFVIPERLGKKAQLVMPSNDAMEALGLVFEDAVFGVFDVFYGLEIELIITILVIAFLLTVYIVSLFLRMRKRRMNRVQD